MFGGVTAAIRPAMSFACSRVNVATATGMSLRVTRCATTSRISVDFPAPGGESTTVTGCPDHTRYSARAVTDPTTIRGSASSGSTTGPSPAVPLTPGVNSSGSRSACPNMLPMCAAGGQCRGCHDRMRARKAAAGCVSPAGAGRSAGIIRAFHSLLRAPSSPHLIPGAKPRWIISGGPAHGTQAMR